MTIAIIGAAGAIGRSVTTACHEAGEPVQLVGRHASRLQDMATAGDTVVEADIETVAGCRAALAGCDTAVYAVGFPYTKGAFAAYPAAMRAFVQAAGDVGLRRAVLITNVYAYGLPQGETVREDQPRNPCSVKGQYRKEQEDIFLSAQSFEAVSLRLPDFYGPGVETSLMTGVAKAARAGKKAMLLSPADTPHEFVFTPDVGPVAYDLLRHPARVVGAYNFAGAGVISQRQLAQQFYKAVGLAPKLGIMAPWMQDALALFVPILRELGEMRYLHETPVLLDDAKLRALLPGLHKTGYEEGARLTMAG